MCEYKVHTIAASSLPSLFCLILVVVVVVAAGGCGGFAFGTIPMLRYRREGASENEKRRSILPTASLLVRRPALVTEVNAIALVFLL